MKRNFIVAMFAAFLGIVLPRTSQAAAPVITGQPESMIVTTGQQAYFIVSDTSSCGFITAQWQFNGVNIQDGPVYSGTNTGILYVNATATQAGSYRIVVSCANGEGSTISNAATLTVKGTSTVMTLPPMIHQLGWSGCWGSDCNIWWVGTNGAINATKLTLAPMGGTPVDVTGLTEATVSPTTSTIYTLTASNSAGTYSRNIFVPVGGYTATISECGTITTPGFYLVTSNITSTSTTTPCLDVKDTDNVFIDCSSGVTITGVRGSLASPGSPPTSGAINFTNVNGFAVRMCKAAPSAQPDFGAFFASFTNSSMGYIFNSTFGDPAVSGRSGLQSFQSNYITFSTDTIYNGIDLHDNSTGNSISSCTIKNTNMVPEQVTPGNVYEWGPGGAYGTQVINSTLDGGAIATNIGADDGIVAASARNDLYAFNLLKNYWDAGIELVEQSYSNTIYMNTLQNAGYEPIGFNRHGTLRDSIVSWNQIDMTGNFQPVGGLAYGIYLVSNAEAGVTLSFQNNNFTHNFITNGAYSGGSKFITAASPGGSWVVGNNLFLNNYFNYNNYPGVPAPAFTTPYLANIVTDGGGNVCAHPNPPGYPLVCH